MFVFVFVKVVGVRYVCGIVIVSFFFSLWISVCLGVLLGLILLLGNFYRFVNVLFLGCCCNSICLLVLISVVVIIGNRKFGLVILVIC